MKQPRSDNPAADSDNPESTHVGWSSGQRTLASLAIAFFLFVVIIAPLSNPIGSASFSTPLANSVAPVHRAMFLGHGYRFFGPDPGPSHLIYYTVTRVNGEKVEGHFPDPEKNWPRLLYHRWFMLSETIFEEHKFTPDKIGFDQTQQTLTNEILAMRDAGNFSMVEKLESRRLAQLRQYENARQRIDELVNSLAAHLTREYDGEKTELFVRERLIASPVDVSAGITLADERYLSKPIPIGPGIVDPVEVLPPATDAIETAEAPSTGGSVQ